MLPYVWDSALSIARRTIRARLNVGIMTLTKPGCAGSSFGDIEADWWGCLRSLAV
jgi:hypothetical protein